jgi:hypothetical protein
MREANLTLCFLFLFSMCFPKCNSCLGLAHCRRGNLDLLKWAEFWLCGLNLEKDWNHEKRLKSWNPENLCGNLHPNHETRLKSWNKLEILKQDQFRKNKNSNICVVLSRRCAPQPGPLFCAENSKRLILPPASTLDFDCCSCKYFSILLPRH